MKTMIKKLSKILGGLLIAALMLNSIPLTGTAHAAAVTISISGITNHSGPALGSGAYVQIIQSANATIGAPDASGDPTGGDIVVLTGTINPDGTFSGAASIPSSQYVAIRVWETWDGIGSPPAGTYYGTSAPENVGVGFVYTYAAAGFATDQQTAVPAPTITRTPAAINRTITQGDTASAATFDVGNSGSATLNYSLAESASWFSLDSSSGTITSGGGDDTINITFTTAALAAGSYSEDITISDPAATNNPQTVTVNLTVNAPGSPTVTGITPNSGNQGQTLGVTISGSNTSWSGDMSGDVDFSGTGITLNSATAASATSIDANITIAGDATLGARDVTVTGASGSATFTVNSSGGGGDFTIDGLTSSGGYPGQTMFLNGTGFGADMGSSTVTVGGIPAMITAWSDTQITTSIPSGVAGGSANVVVTTASDTLSASLTVLTTGAVIDDVEGGSVGNWPPTIDGFADTGYYAFGSGVTPDNTTISADGPQASAAAHGARGMRIRYSYTSDWGGGWGAKLANTLDLSAFDKIVFYIAWDGSSNDVTISIKDADGTAYATTVSNTTLTSSTGYSQITKFYSSFALDVDGSDDTSDGVMDWSQVTSYNILYRSTGTSATYHSIDSIVAGDAVLGDDPVDPVDPTEILITDIDPDAGPAGSKFIANGEGFGNVQGQSILVFENTTSGINYDVQVLSWSDTSIEAIVPRLAPAGSYQLKVLKLAISQGNMTAQESNAETFQVTANAPAPGIATVFPNPFNPLETSVPATRASGLPASTATIAYDASGSTNIGIYIYSSTGRLVYRAVTSDPNQVTWDGTDSGGGHVADGVYLLRVVNEESKATIAKAKILVIKR